MGLLSSGTPLTWHASQPYRRRVKHDGVSQFLSIYRTTKHFKDHDLRWGDELEYFLLHTDPHTNKVTLSLRAPQILHILQQPEHAQPEGSSVPTLWRPEFARWMIEGTPGIPYRCYAADLVNVERNMALRRRELTSVLNPNEHALTIPAFPRLGCAVYTMPPTMPFGPVSRSLFTSDDVINPHPRFATLAANIRTRRGGKVDIRVPLFVDEFTESVQPIVPQDADHLKLLAMVDSNLRANGKSANPDINTLADELSATASDTIVMDSAAFGMGNCCLQVTIQGRDLAETRYLYDQLAVMAPLMLALTAGTPVLRGLLADTDVRWDVIAASMDDRTLYERQSGSVPKSRYSSIDCFLSCRHRCKPESYNDLPVPIDNEVYDRLVAGGVDHLLAQHIAHLFIRDPLVIYEEKVEQDNQLSADHFENIQSTNWNTVRFKPPPPGTGIGWRTEFRSMEVSLTDFENAAFSVFVVLLSRVILAFNLNFYIPMSKVDDNMESAHRRDAVNRESFYFRNNVFKSSDGAGFLCECGHIHNASLVGGLSQCDDINTFCSKDGGSGSDSDGDPFELLTLDEIFNGKPLCRNGLQAGFAFPGLIPLMRGYLDALKIDGVTRARLFTYLDFVSHRASGKLLTTATYMRRFVQSHTRYMRDSVVTEEINNDLLDHLQKITRGEISAPELLGNFQGESAMETADTMMQLMQRKPEGQEAALLHGSSMPKGALDDTLRSIARDKSDSRCKC